jgi:YidC/Oxa1 family membrane protein insertase
MDIKKLVLVMIFFTSGLFLWEEWQREQLPQPPNSKTETQAGQRGAAIPGNVAKGVKGGPDTQLQNGAPVPGEKLISSQLTTNSNSGEGVTPTAVTGSLESGTKIQVKTDMVFAEIDTAGGDIRHLELLHHPSREDKNIPFALLQNEFPRVNVAQSGLIGKSLPTHKTSYAAEAESYTLTAGEDKVEIRLSAPEVGGIKATKIYTFHRGSYLIDVRFEIDNQGSSVLQPFSYFQVLRDSVPVEASMFMVPQFTGATVYTEEEKFQKVKFPDLVDGTLIPKIPITVGLPCKSIIFLLPGFRKIKL